MASQRTPVDPATTKRDTGGPVPPGNEPGHHPDVEQDKPLGRRPRNRRAQATEDRPQGGQTGTTRFGFRFSGVAGVAARAVVLHERRAYVAVSEDEVVARFGPWVVRTPRSNVAGCEVTGPYAAWKVTGPPHVSFADRGLTFATNTERGACLRFHEPVAGIEPTGRLRHPGLTVTVDDPAALAALLSS